MKSWDQTSVLLSVSGYHVCFKGILQIVCVFIVTPTFFFSPKRALMAMILVLSLLWSFQIYESKPVKLCMRLFKCFVSKALLHKTKCLRHFIKTVFKTFIFPKISKSNSKIFQTRLTVVFMNILKVEFNLQSLPSQCLRILTVFT